MENKKLILLKTLLCSGGRFNILKYEKDKKKRGKIIGGMVGLACLYLFLICFAIFPAIGLGAMGLAESIPSLCAIIIILLEFFFTLLEAGSHLYAFKEYDMLMAMPIKTKSIVSCKFLHMYLINLPYSACISISMMIVYALFEKVGFITCLFWILLTLILPLIPMVLASAIASLIAKAGSKSRHKTLVQTILTFVFVILCFASRYIIEAVIRENQVENIMTTLADIMNSAKVYVPMAAWFEDAVLTHSVSGFLLLVGLSIIVYEIFIILLGKYYREINSGLSGHAKKAKFKMERQKTKSAVQSVAFKEFRHFMNSTAYITNMGVGEILVILLCILLLFVDVDRIIATVTGNSPLTKEMLLPAIPLIVYFFIGMCSTTSASFSLEGKNYWIVQSLPLSIRDLVLGKMLFNMYLTVPFSVIGTICFSIACKATFLQMVLFIICGFALCAFSTAFGMRCNLKHYKHDWENEIEVIKQGASVALYLFPNMFGCMILTVIAVILGGLLGTEGVTLVVCGLACLLTLLSYFSIKHYL